MYTIHREKIIHILSTWEREYKKCEYGTGLLEYSVCQKDFDEADKICERKNFYLNGRSVGYISILECNKTEKAKLYAYVPDLESSIRHIEENREWSKQYIIKKKKRLSELREQINQCIKCVKERKIR